MYLRCALLFFCFTAVVNSADFFQSSDAIPGEYIVVLNEDATSQILSQHTSELSESSDSALIKSEFHNLRGFKAFAVAMDVETLKQELHHPDVLYIQPNTVMRTSDACNIQSNVQNWGLDRISERDIQLDGRYIYGSTGKGVDAYIIDTGIYIEHNDFEGRASWGFDYYGGQEDCNGHGTHVASTVGGKQYGVAKNVNLIAVRVLSCVGQGSDESVIAGIDYVAQQKTSNGKPSVANLSLGGSKSRALNQAIEACVDAGVTVVVAAGNEDKNACRYSPASSAAALTVAATFVDDDSGTEEDARTSFSNWGKCVDIAAPGSLITAAWIDGVSSTNTISGTSMASPHVAGVAALVLGKSPSSTPAEVISAISSNASPDLMRLDCADFQFGCKKTPNLLLFGPECS